MNTREKLLLVWACTATSLLLVGAMVVFQIIQPRSANSIRLGRTADFAEGSHILFECDRSAERCAERTGFNSDVVDFAPSSPSIETAEIVRVWILHPDEATWRALIATSPHRGCFVSWNEKLQRFEDGCYGSKWNETGKYLEGPAPRGLDSFPVRVVNDDVWIDFKLVRGKNHD